MFMHLLCILCIKIFTKPPPREHRPCPWVRLGAVGCPYSPCTCLHYYVIIFIIIYLLYNNIVYNKALLFLLFLSVVVSLPVPVCLSLAAVSVCCGCLCLLLYTVLLCSFFYY